MDSDKHSSSKQHPSLIPTWLQSRPQSPRPLDQRSGSAWALVESKTGNRKSWFRFDSARASEIVVEMNKFQQPMRFGRFFGGLSV